MQFENLFLAFLKPRTLSLPHGGGGTVASPDEGFDVVIESNANTTFFPTCCPGSSRDPIMTPAASYESLLCKGPQGQMPEQSARVMHSGE